jgi:hypothetical protein
LCWTAAADAQRVALPDEVVPVNVYPLRDTLVTVKVKVPVDFVRDELIDATPDVLVVPLPEPLTAPLQLPVTAAPATLLPLASFTDTCAVAWV